jgi:hypothetical protein
MTKKKVNYTYMLSIDGAMAPKFEHDSEAEAIQEANRLADVLNTNATIRVLRLESVLKTEKAYVTVKNWINP